ncbi:hypothetical protein [Microcella sp.]|uniref:hypothetical protein n=1 Tax=Microcella sp. TaxID=1913979 RepID=UPI00391D21FB
MRKLNKHAKRSAKREEYRARYAAYISSAAWRAVRQGWVDEYRLRNDVEPACEVCDHEWELARDDLHHHTYERLTAEAFEDLAPLCRSCHDLVHETVRESRHWSQMRDIAASRKVIDRLRHLRAVHRQQVSRHSAGQEGAA